MSTRHVCDGESSFVVVNITPDFCIVDGNVVPFEIYQELASEKVYAETVYARTQPVLIRWSVIRGVVGNAGSGVISSVSLAAGDAQMIEGSGTVNVEGEPVCRHFDLCLMNGS